jgi:tRNA/rRNA methyltransferase
VRPESGANVGASARALRNGGLAGLDLVAPGDWRTVECWRTAWGAQDVLEEARVFPDLASAISGAGYVAGFTGRLDAGVPWRDVREVAEDVAALDPGESAALVFGPETAGLTLDELGLCGTRARIPASPSQPSLNLSHAVMVASYEVQRAGARLPPRPRAATWEEKRALLDLLHAGLLGVRALPPRDPDGSFDKWERLVFRADLTPGEVRLLEHMARRMARA